MPPYFDSLGFVIRPDRSIHDSLSVEFLKILGAGAWQEDMMRDGLVFLSHFIMEYVSCIAFLNSDLNFLFRLPA